MGRADTAICYNAKLEGSRVLDGSEAMGWLPMHCFQPTLKDIEKGPGGEKSLVGDCPGKLIPQEKNG